MKRKQLDFDDSHVLDLAYTKAYMLAGNAIFSVVNDKTGNHMTYKVSRKKDKATDKGEEEIWFVSVSYNYESFRCIGIITKNQFFPSKKVDAETPSVKGFAIIWKRYCIENKPMENVRILHSKYCARCGRLLTEPDSISRGMGMYCASLSQKAKYMN